MYIYGMLMSCSIYPAVAHQTWGFKALPMSRSSMRWTRPELKLFIARLFELEQQMMHLINIDMFMICSSRCFHCFGFPHVIPFQFFCCSSHVFFFFKHMFFPTVFLTADKTTDPASFCFLEVVPQLFRTVVHKQAQTLQSGYFGRKIWEDRESPDVMFRCQQCHRS